MSGHWKGVTEKGWRVKFPNGGERCYREVIRPDGRSISHIHGEGVSTLYASREIPRSEVPFHVLYNKEGLHFMGETPPGEISGARFFVGIWS